MFRRVCAAVAVEEIKRGTGSVCGWIVLAVVLIVVSGRKVVVVLIKTGLM